MTVEEWVDAVLDYYETRTWGRYDPWEKSWEKNIYGKFPLPPVIDLNHSDFDPQALQDAMVWLHDGGLKPYEIAVILRVSKKGIGKRLEQLDSEYDDEYDDAGTTSVSG
jgi:hypothetical protein